MIFFDIETGVTTLSKDMLPEIKAPSNYKDPAVIQKYVEEKRKSQIEDSALDPDLGRIRSIAWIDSSKPEEKHILKATNDAEEGLMISAFIQSLYYAPNHSICGYNIISFDIPYIQRRAMYLKAYAHNFPPVILNAGKRYSTYPVLDLYSVLYNWQPGKGLKWVCKRLGIKNEMPDLDPLLISDELIGDYCFNDVTLTRQLFDYMQGKYFTSDPTQD